MGIRILKEPFHASLTYAWPVVWRRGGRVGRTPQPASCTLKRQKCSCQGDGYSRFREALELLIERRNLCIFSWWLPQLRAGIIHICQAQSLASRLAISKSSGGSEVFFSSIRFLFRCIVSVSFFFFLFVFSLLVLRNNHPSHWYAFSHHRGTLHCCVRSLGRTRTKGYRATQNTHRSANNTLWYGIKYAAVSRRVQMHGAG